MKIAGASTVRLWQSRELWVDGEDPASGEMTSRGRATAAALRIVYSEGLAAQMTPAVDCARL